MITLEPRVLLSGQGSDRGTAYGSSNKIIRLEDRLYVGWLDAPSSDGDTAKIQFGVCDPDSGELRCSLTLGLAEDNHCGPAMVIDGMGRVHVIIGSHGQHHKRGKGAFFYRWSDTPDDAASWSEPERLGPADTYPALFVDSKNTLHLLHRECGLTNDERWQLWYRRKPQGRPWETPRALVVSPTRGYCNWGHSLRIGPDDSLHALFQFHYGPTGSNKDCKTYAVACLDSIDGGTTWRSDGKPLSAYPSEMADLRLMKKHDDAGVGCSNLLVDREGHPAFLVTGLDDPAPVLWRRTASGWVSAALRGDLWEGGEHAPLKSGALTWDAEGRIHLVTSASPDGESTRWDDPRLELYHQVYGLDGVRRSSARVTPGDPSAAFWHPSVELWDWHRAACAGGHWLLYTHGLNQGGIGGNNQNALKTHIYLTRI